MNEYLIKFYSHQTEPIIGDHNITMLQTPKERRTWEMIGGGREEGEASNFFGLGGV
jgi:hypothetical protein